MAKDTSQVGLRLPSETLKKLQQDPDGVSEAIRRRLEWTFEIEKFDDASRDLSHAVMHLSRQVRLHTGNPWGESEGVRRTLLAAIDFYTAAVSQRPVAGEDRTDRFDDDPQKLGASLARAYIQLSKETQEEDDGTQAW